MDSIVNIMLPQVRAKDQGFDAAAYEILAEDVCCDSVRLNKVLTNLWGNAVKFTPDRGKVQVNVCQEDLPGNPSCVRTHFIVRDTGIGMSKEYQKQIFDSFSRENNTRVQKTEGSGLGSAITSRGGPASSMLCSTLQRQKNRKQSRCFHPGTCWWSMRMSGYVQAWSAPWRRSVSARSGVRVQGAQWK